MEGAGAPSILFAGDGMYVAEERLKAASYIAF